MKLTDALFNLDFIAANCGAEKAVGGNIFAYETLTSDATGKVTLSAEAVPVVSNGSVNIWAHKSAENVDYAKFAAEADKKSFMGDANTEYCVMYRKAANGEQITISSQFIPETLHAVLTVALYSGDSCNLEAGTKAGEVVIDIPRLQLTGAMDITSATCF